MNRSDRHKHKLKNILFSKDEHSESPSVIQKIVQYAKISTYALFLILITIILGIHLYLESSTKIEAPKKDLGRKIVIELPNEKKVYTYENLIVEKDGKLYYEGKFNQFNVTGGVIKYENWK